MSQNKLRFAPIIRVSTEQQKDKGESLAVQRKQITQYVEMIEGTIPDHCWKYVGQEHATPEHERGKLDQLLQDSSKDLFDAVIVADTSRWSRDNKRSKEGLEILKKNDTRFFVGTMEFDLYNPQDTLILGISGEINEWQAKTQTLKSVQSKIEKIRQGKPAAGKPPFGRTWSEEEGWGIDEEKKRIVEQAAKRYLDGESMKKIARSYGLDYTNLLRTLKYKCHDKWEVSFNVERLNIETTEVVDVPRLLPEETIKAVHRRAEKNKKYHGTRRAKYLLGKYIFCAGPDCGYSLTGNANTDGRRYYRHATHRNAKDCEYVGHIRAAELETAVLAHLKKTFGNPEKVRNAIARANPDAEQVKALEREKARLEKERDKLVREGDRIVEKVGKGLLGDNEVENRMTKIRKQKNAKNERIDAIENKLSNLVGSKRATRLSKLAVNVFKDANRSPRLDDMSYEEARKLIEHAFDGEDAEGKPLGVYVKWQEDRNHKVEIRGILEKTLLAFPLDDEALAELYELDPAYCDIEEELQKIKKRVNEYSWYKWSH